jgi:hypothetical protein
VHRITAAAATHGADTLVMVTAVLSWCVRVTCFATCVDWLVSVQVQLTWSPSMTGESYTNWTWPSAACAGTAGSEQAIIANAPATAIVVFISRFPPS